MNQTFEFDTPLWLIRSLYIYMKFDFIKVEGSETWINSKFPCWKKSENVIIGFNGTYIIQCSQ